MENRCTCGHTMAQRQQNIPFTRGHSEDLRQSPCYTQKSICHRVSFGKEVALSHSLKHCPLESVFAVVNYSRMTSRLLSHSVNMFSLSFVSNLDVYLFDLGQMQTETERYNAILPFFSLVGCYRVLVSLHK